MSVSGLKDVRVALATERRLLDAPTTPGEGFAYFRWRTNIPLRIFWVLMGNPYREAVLLMVWKEKRWGMVA